MLAHTENSTNSAPDAEISGIPGVPRVLFYDYWTKGLDKFTRIFEGSREPADLQLLHTGSFRDRKAPRAEVLRGIPCTDISMFRPRGLESILATVQPDVVVGLNAQTLFDRAMFLTCQRVGIPTVFLQHGVWPEPDQRVGYAAQMNAGFGVSDYLRRIPAFAYWIPTYFRARSNSWREVTPWRVVSAHVFKPGSAHLMPLHATELWPTKALVFSQQDADQLIGYYKMPEDRIEVIGNPELDAVARRRRTPVSAEVRASALARIGLKADVPTLCYLEEGFVEQQHFAGWSSDRRTQALKEISAVCAGLRIQLLVRPHPASNAAEMHAALSSQSHAVVSRDLSLDESLDFSAAVVGMFSTALDSALALGRPIVVPIWHAPDLEPLSPYLRHEAGARAQNPEQLRALIRRILDGDPPTTHAERYVRLRLGPMDGCAADRARAAILSRARSHLGLDRAERTLVWQKEIGSQLYVDR